LRLVATQTSSIFLHPSPVLLDTALLVILAQKVASSKKKKRNRWLQLISREFWEEQVSKEDESSNATPDCVSP
jgi:hypothetical protein